MAKSRLKINFVVNPVFDGWSPDDDRLGGTEESVVEWAKELVRRGHEVTVLANVPRLERDGVYYRQYMDYRPADKAINVKFLDFHTHEPAWYLTNETNARDLNLKDFAGVILPSKWAFDNLGVIHSDIRIVPHGYDTEQIYPEPKIKNQCLYASSPDRGLDQLIDHWPTVVEHVPDAQLLITYNGYLDLPNTICLGSVDLATMNELYRRSDFWLHPCLGGELFCMAAVKAQVAGAIPVIYPTMALLETVRHGIRSNHEHYAYDLINIMQNDHKQHWLRDKLKYEHFADWKDSTDILEGILREKII